MQAWLPFLLPPLVLVLFVFELRRKWARRARRRRRRAGTLTAEDRLELAALEEYLPWRESLRRFLRGAPTRRLTLHDLWDTWQGLIGAGLLVFLVYQIGVDAVEDPNARAVVFATIGAIVVVGALGLLWRRYRARRGGLGSP